LVHISKSKIKKSGISKKLLQQKVIKGREYTLPLAVVNIGKVNPHYIGQDIQIIHEDKNFIILSKPQKIHCHPIHYNESDNLVSYIREFKAPLDQINGDGQDRGLLFRLDYETSGLIYYAKNDDIYTQFRNEFKGLVKTKLYLAIVHGHVKDAFECTHYLRTSGQKGHKIIACDRELDGTHEAKIKVIPKSYHPEEDISLVEVQLEQGHRHQIRVQLAEAGYVIKGDELYGAKSADRLYLHSYQYTFNWNDKEYKSKDKSCDLFSNFFDLNSVL